MIDYYLVCHSEDMYFVLDFNSGIGDSDCKWRTSLLQERHVSKEGDQCLIAVTVISSNPFWSKGLLH